MSVLRAVPIAFAIGLIRFNPYKIHGIGAPCRFSVHSADRTPAAAILNKKCLLRTGTVSVNKEVAVSQPQAHYDPPLRCECGSEDTVAYM